MVEPAGSNGASNGSKKLLHQDEQQYTHGGVKKTKFEPKVPTRRAKKLPPSSTSKSEQPQPPTAADSNSLPKELHRLLQQQTSATDHGRGRERTSRVAFGFGNSSTKSSESKPSPSRVIASVPRPSSTSVSTAVSRPSRVPEKQEFLHASEPKPDRNVEVFDHEKYYPVTLPLRKPIARVDTRSLDDEEFVEDDKVVEDEEDEDGAEAAEELGLRAQKDEDSMFFFQFPKGLPLSLNATGKEKEKEPLRAARLEDLGKGGAMGKLLVYESGAVKLKIGDVVFDALPGTACTFAQEVAAVNTTSKQCSFVGEVHQRVVLTPDIIDVLPDLTDLRTKR